LPHQKVQEASPDQAATWGRQDYDTHILGRKQTPVAGDMDNVAGSGRGESLGGQAAARAQFASRVVSQASVRAEEIVAPGKSSVSPAAGTGSELFVALNLDLKNHPDTTLKDAVADLVRTSGFRQDVRFAPAAVGAGPDQVALWGWMPTGRVDEALKVPVVTRIEVSPAPRRAALATATDLLLGVRVPRGSDLSEAGARAEQELSACGVRVKRTIGTQTAPGTAETILVIEAVVPINALSRLMARPDVVKMAPVPEAEIAPLPRDATPGLQRFFDFVVKHSPLLLVLTLLMLLPWVVGGLAAACRVFVPYR